MHPNFFEFLKEDNSSDKEVFFISASCTPISEILVPVERGENSAINMYDEVDPDVNSIIFFGKCKVIDFFKKLSFVNIEQNWKKSFLNSFLGPG